MVQKTVLITGCSEGGIGDALAQEFHRKGLKVFATARNLTRIRHLEAQGLDILPLDVVDEGSIKQAMERVKLATGGTLDFLVNNSGFDTEVSVAKKMFDVNVFAIVTVTQAFSPLLIAAKGTIINIGSAAGKFPLPWQGFYNASKAAANLLTDQLRIELKPFGVNAINVVTGGVRTNFFENQPSTRLPANSLYAAGRGQVEWAANGGLVKKEWMHAEQYAEYVVKNALKRNPSVNHWVGSSSFFLWFVTTFLWHTYFDFALPRVFEFPDFNRKIEAASS